MIVKRGMTPADLKLQQYTQKDQVVHAKRMSADFMIETGKGWENCKKGMWIVHIGPDLWTAVDHEQFVIIYRLCDRRRGYSASSRKEAS